ncbi:hypothetical protein COLO4_22420 [Corchorus olitorius]|uniref:Plastid lipid-associated protein/fibrillin conserved domain-containing protein n=1 Tax=Corchorus olitorius TaxID=93759 RepID=A0A1R3ILX3_9ROSI|nr:hypothetical protein COLO4_22420 [Corchorus olitorius]
MASKFFHHPVPPSQADPFTFTPKITRMIAAQNLAPALQLRTKSLRLFKPSSGFRHTIHYTINAAGESTGQKEKEASKDRTVDLIKADFYRAVQGINRGIFGVQSARKSEIEELVELLESRNPTPDPALHLDKVGGCWRLVYSTITILGVKRTKLGLRHFLTLGNIYQTIDVAKLTIEASFKISSKSVTSPL